MSLRASTSRAMSNGSSPSSTGLTTTPPCLTAKFDSNSARLYDLDIEKVLNTMEKGQKICKLVLGKRWEQNLRLHFGRETRQLLIQKHDGALQKSKQLFVDIRHVKEVQTLDYKVNQMRISDKWKRDKELNVFDPSKILVIHYGTSFNLSHWILSFETPDACKLWIQGLQHLMQESYTACHPLLVERWLRKEFYALANPSTLMICSKHMKPFVQGRLQCKIQSRNLQELVEEQMAYEAFANAYRRLIHVHSLFSDRFAAYSDDGYRVDFTKFLRFLLKDQKDEMGSRKDLASEFLRRYLKDVDVARDTTEPYLSVQEFVDFLFSRENSVWDPVHNEVRQNMDLPLSSYWIASSHNTYLTGDQLKSESSLEAYARALLMGCRCIELDCWPGQKKGTEADVIIYHGFTITTKVALRDVLYTIREYAFITSE